MLCVLRCACRLGTRLDEVEGRLGGAGAGKAGAGGGANGSWADEGEFRARVSADLLAMRTDLDRSAAKYRDKASEQDRLVTRRGAGRDGAGPGGAGLL